MKVFGLRNNEEKIILPHPEDICAIIQKTDGSAYRKEPGWGTGYFSASFRLISYNGPVKKITLIDNKGNKRDLVGNDKIESKPGKKKEKRNKF